MLWLLLPLMAGVAAGRAEVLPFPPLALLAVSGLLAAAAVWAAWWPRLAYGWAPALGLALLLAGAAAHALRCGRLPEWEGLPPREARLALRIDQVFPQSGAAKTAGLATVVHGDGPLRELAGRRLYFSLALRPGAAPLVPSAVVSAVGVLTALSHTPPADSFDGRLADAGIHFRLARGRVLAVEQPPAGRRAFCEHVAERWNALLGAGVAVKRPGLTAIFRAMMLGRKRELDDPQRTLFLHSGTMHLFAINGLHIGVVAVSLHALLAALRCPRPAAALVTLAILWLDVDATGESPSAVRAFLLVACFELAPVLRRPANGLAALSTAALLVLLADPLALFSASFQMSYGVVLTILCFGLPLAERLQARWHPFAYLPEAAWTWWQRGLAALLRRLAAALGIGLAAMLVSAVTGAAFFHGFAPGGLAANLVLMPLAMLVIIAGVASITAGQAGAAALGVLFNHAAVMVLWGMDALIRLGVRVPGAWWPVTFRAAWIGPTALATLLAACLAGYALHWRRAAVGFWVPPALAALTLILGVKFG